MDGLLNFILPFLTILEKISSWKSRIVNSGNMTRVLILHLQYSSPRLITPKNLMTMELYPYAISYTKSYPKSLLFASSPSYQSRFPRRNLHSSIIDRSMKPSVLHKKVYTSLSSRTLKASFSRSTFLKLFKEHDRHNFNLSLPILVSHILS